MYDIPYFKEENPQKVLDFIRSNPFGMLIGCSSDQPVATQVPFLLEEKNGEPVLTGHIMKSTDHHLALQKNSNVLCVFTGSHSYVSARWYDNQQTASTWNYMSVHVRGKLRFMEGDELTGILQRTTSHFENDHDSPSGFHHLPGDYVEKLQKAIVGVEVEIISIDNVFKLSQNKTAAEKERIISGLKTGDLESQQVANEMEKRRSTRS